VSLGFFWVPPPIEDVHAGVGRAISLGKEQSGANSAPGAGGKKGRAPGAEILDTSQQTEAVVQRQWGDWVNRTIT